MYEAPTGGSTSANLVVRCMEVVIILEMVSMVKFATRNIRAVLKRFRLMLKSSDIWSAY
jgi:hypothetical protein